MDPERTLILLDVTSAEGERFERSFLERNGHEVVVCHGPHQGELCPMLSGEGCQWVDDAHGVIFELDLDRPQHRAILKRYREVMRPEVPIRAVVRPGQPEAYAAELEGVEVVTKDLTAADLDGFAAEVEAGDR